MKIIFVSNFFNHHQKPLVYALNNIENVSCVFIALEKMPQERKKLGYSGEDDKYVKHFSDIKNETEQMIKNCDALIVGGIRSEFINIANRYNVPVFVFSERLFKDKNNTKNMLRALKYASYRRNLKNAYLLSASGFAYSDYKKCGLFADKSLKWGYFPKCQHYLDVNKLIDNKEKNSILWCGRFLHWKHPDHALTVVKKLVENGYDVNLDFIGIGEELEKVKALVNDFELNDRVDFLGSMPPDEVRHHMEKTDVFLMTSDRREGWGAVINEAMNSACSVVASNDAGAVPFLINDGADGLVYQSENVDMLYEKVKFLLDNKQESDEIKRMAYHTIADLWNENVAARRLTKFIKSLPDEEYYFNTGPCSKC